MNGVVFGMIGKLRGGILGLADRRVKLVNELILGVRVLKFYCWEKPFQRMVEDVRAQELKLIKKAAYVVAVGFSIVLLSAPTLLPVRERSTTIARDAVQTVSHDH